LVAVPGAPVVEPVLVDPHDASESAVNVNVIAASTRTDRCALKGLCLLIFMTE